MSRGYFAIGICAGKCPANAGTLMRSAQAFGAAMVFTAGCRYPVGPTDTPKAWRYIPAVELDAPADLLSIVPRGAQLVGVECGELKTRPLESFAHPERAVYVLGAEDRGLPPLVVEACDVLVEIPSARCLNVAVAGSIVMYDRVAKRA